MNKKNDLMKGVYQSFLNAGLSPQQAAVFSAEVGRENDFNPKYIFGSHGDKANLDILPLLKQGDSYCG